MLDKQGHLRRGAFPTIFQIKQGVGLVSDGLVLKFWFKALGRLDQDHEPGCASGDEADRGMNRDGLLVGLATHDARQHARPRPYGSGRQ
jgi:hypothetical protein